MSSRPPGVSLQPVRRFGQALAVLAFFVFLNVVAALVMLALGKLVPQGLREEPLAWFAVGILGVAACLVIAVKLPQLIGRWLSRSPVAAPVPPRQASTTSPGRNPSSSGS